MSAWYWLFPVAMLTLAFWAWHPVGRVPPGQ
jgi:hypothetical protein